MLNLLDERTLKMDLWGINEFPCFLEDNLLDYYFAAGFSNHFVIVLTMNNFWFILGGVYSMKLNLLLKLVKVDANS